MKNSNYNVKLLGALLIGAVAGSALGILMAPDKGSKTRKKLLSQGQDLSDSLKKNISGFLGDIKEEFVSIKDKASMLLENGIAKVDKIKNN